MSSAEEESFIILEETPSLAEPYSLLQIPKSIEPNSSTFASIRTVDLMDETDNNGGEIGVGKPIDETPLCLFQTKEMSIKQSSLAPSQTKESVSPNLAESFLLGAIDHNTMMNSVSINFPSLVNSGTKTEDIERLQSLMHEHNALKENLERSNVTMRQQFSLVNSWLENVKGLKATHQKEIDELKRVNLELIDENKELKQKLGELQSAKKATTDDNVAVAAAVAAAATHEKVKNEAKKRCEELDVLVQNLQVELSNAIADKLEIEEMKKAYIDEIDCVQVNLVATEELFKASKAETMELKAVNATLKQDLKTLQNTLNAQQDEMNVIKAQLEVYKTDFELERAARQEIAGQKEQLSADLQLLQRRNQMLLDGITDGDGATAAPTVTAPQEPPIPINSSSASEATVGDNSMFPTYRCPVCSTTYANVNNLYRHVNKCLEKLE